MNKLLNITDRANTAIHALAYIAAKGNKPQSVTVLADKLKTSKTYLAKILQQLVKEEILTSTRGASGGFTLTINPDEITVLQLLEKIDGPIPENNCLFGFPVCGSGKCKFSEMNKEIKDKVTKELSSISLRDLAENFK